MTGDQIVVLSNDVVPGMGLPVAAPGLRAWGIAQGLRAHGHDVTIAVDRNVVKRARTGYLPPTRPSGTLLVGPRQVGDMIRLRGTRALVMTNSNHIERIGDLEETKLVYDFFAPKMLELSLQASPETRDEQMEILRRRKIGALQKSSAVIINGAKKVSYVHEWLAKAADPVPLDHTAVVNMPLPPQVSLAPSDGPVHAIVAGYIQPWSMPGEWADVIRPFLEDGSLVLHLLVVNHWGSKKGRTASVPENFARLFGLPGVVQHGPMEFDDFRRLLASCHLSIDLFERNPERELAMVTRTAVSLSCGLPVVHVPFTETSEFVRDHGAGWLVESEDLDGIRNALEEAVSDRGILAAKRAGAEEVAREVLEPAKATAPLHRILEDLG